MRPSLPGGSLAHVSVRVPLTSMLMCAGAISLSGL